MPGYISPNSETGITPPKFIDLDNFMAEQPYQKRIFRQKGEEAKSLQEAPNEAITGLKVPPMGTGSMVAYYLNFEDQLTEHILSGSVNPFYEAALSEGWYIGTVVDFVEYPDMGLWLPHVLRSQLRSSESCIESSYRDVFVTTNPLTTFLIDSATRYRSISEGGAQKLLGDRVRVLKEVYQRWVYGIVIEISDDGTGRLAFDQGGLSDRLQLDSIEPVGEVNGQVGDWKWHGSTCARIDKGVANNVTLPRPNRLNDAKKRYTDWIFSNTKDNGHTSSWIGTDPPQNIYVARSDFIFDLEFIIMNSREDITPLSGAQMSFCNNLISESEDAANWATLIDSSDHCDPNMLVIDATYDNAQAIARRLPGEYTFIKSGRRIAYVRNNGTSGYANPNQACCIMGTGSLGTHCDADYADTFSISGLLLFNKEITSLSMEQSKCSNLISQYCGTSLQTLLGEDCQKFMKHGEPSHRLSALQEYCATADGTQDEGCLCVNKPVSLIDFCGSCYMANEDGYFVSDKNEDAYSRYQNSFCEFPNIVDEMNAEYSEALNKNQQFENDVYNSLQEQRATNIKSKDIITLALAAAAVLIGILYTFIPSSSPKRGNAETPFLRRLAYLVGLVTVVSIYLVLNGFTFSSTTNLFANLKSKNYTLDDNNDERDTGDANLVLVEWEPGKDDTDILQEYVAADYCFNPAPCDQYPGYVTVKELLADNDVDQSVPVEYLQGFDDCCLPMTAYAGREGAIGHHQDILKELGIAIGTGLLLDKLLAKDFLKKLVTAYHPLKRVANKLKRVKINPVQQQNLLTSQMRARMNARKITMKALTKNIESPANLEIANSLRKTRKGIRRSAGSVSSITKSSTTTYVQRAIRTRMMQFSGSYSKLLFSKCARFASSRPLLRSSVGFVGKTAGKSALMMKNAIGAAVGKSVAFYVKKMGGPISALWFIFDAASMIWDFVDDAKLNTFASNRSMLTLRDQLDKVMWDSSVNMARARLQSEDANWQIGDGKEATTTGTFVTFPLQFMYPLEYNSATEDLFSEALIKAIEKKSEDANWEIGFEAYRAQLLSQAEYNSSDHWNKSIVDKATEIMQDNQWRDERMCKLIAKHIYNTNFQPATLRAARTCSWWMLARPRVKCDDVIDQNGKDHCMKPSGGQTSQADISISGIEMQRGLFTIRISGYDVDSIYISGSGSEILKTTVVAIRLDSMEYDDTTPVLPDPDVPNSLLLWITFLCLLAECSGRTMSIKTGSVCHIDAELGPSLSCEAHTTPHHTQDAKDTHHAKDGKGASDPTERKMQIRSIFRTSTEGKTGQKHGLGRAMWLVIPPRPWHDLEHQMEGTMSPGTSRLIENYDFDSSATHVGFGLSQLGCEAWNKSHLAFWGGSSKVLSDTFQSSGIYSSQTMLMSTCAAIYTNNYGKPVDDTSVVPKIVKQYLPNHAFAALQMAGYGPLITACTGEVQDARSTDERGNVLSRKRYIDSDGNEAVEKTDHGFGKDRFHIQPTYDYGRRMCAYTHAWCSSYGMDFSLCREGEDHGQCTKNFTKKACEDPDVFPDCHMGETDKVAELFFGQNMTRRVFKNLDYNVWNKMSCLTDTNLEECDVFGVDPFTLETKCWDSKEEHCTFDSCKKFDQSF